MLQSLSKLKVVDTSGVGKVKCLQLQQKGKFKEGNKVKCSLIQVKKNYKKGELQEGLIVRTRNWNCYKTGLEVKYGENGLILIQKLGRSKELPVGKRFQGPLSKQLQNQNRLWIEVIAKWIY